MLQRSKTALIWIALLFVVLLILLKRDDRRPEQSPSVITSPQAIRMIKQDDVVGWRVDEDGMVTLQDVYGGEHLHFDPNDSSVTEALAAARIPVRTESRQQGSDEDGSMIYWILLPLLVVVFVLFFLKRMGAANNNLFELRKSKARAIEDESKVRFSDIGGHVNAVEMMQDLVDFLRDPKRWKSAGARIPRGILLVGPPGTGKTLLAKAVAGETDASFFYTSATEFVEMFVGVGAARVRDTFENAGKAQPAVIFIDELDAIGRARSSGMGTMHEEREQTLNQLLVLMDGLERFERVVVIAATNRPDVLDKALMRPGRFDRIVRLDAPTAEDRIEILRIHSRDKPMDDSVSVETLSAHVKGLTGADIETVLNQAAILAVRRCRSDGSDRVTITEDDVRNAVTEMRKGNRQFNRLDSVLVESVTQFAEPTGRAVARVTTISGNTIEGDVVWMNGTHIKLQTAGGEVVVSKELAERIETLEGTETSSDGDFSPDGWTRPNLDVG